MPIRLFVLADRPALWAVLEPVIRAGNTYALPRDMSEDDALAYWLAPDKTVFVADDDGAIIGSYYLRANHAGGGAHVANCGYIVRESASGRGIGRRMCEHSVDRARAAGFHDMQFNFVVSTNKRAVALWQLCGFAVVGTLPRAFLHPAMGYVDALVMHRKL
ncbi:GNAT family N-acetyltransferase [Sphingomonas immobilis]|uniref:GNAT family N-acetyltransferase n=1 Tax=Sphingomonas immobilis TaxID=3063997 RepID=A0ABT9A3Y3_9SPHN|nr:GNAT family N-acetyltransferase [Sphingomonas sp. CA1-15]MDO7844553.1 GNAT family N-acetyltransferase [Sphingomonas sp. CA1-15]